MEYKYYFTIFVPAYNRAHTLERLFLSVEKQTFRNFELIIVDDGSTDNTKEVLNELKNKVSFPFQYYYQENKGKPSARNLAIKKATGKLFKTIDSDDFITEDCLEVMKYYWESIDEQERDKFAGVIGLCANIKNNKVIGDEFPEDIFDSNHIINNVIYKIKGDKTQCIRTDLLKVNLFPVFEGEKFIQESIVWNRIGINYKFRYVNKILMYKEYMDDGLTRNRLINSLSNKRGTRFYFKEYINVIAPNYKIPLKELVKKYANFIRFSFHCDDGIIAQNREIKSKILHILTVPLGYVLWKNDLRKIKTFKK